VTKDEFEQAAFDRLFSTWDQEFVKTREGAEAIDDVLYKRQQRAEAYAVKWMSRFLDLSSAIVVEIGCGTGAASIPLARVCKKLVGLDIDGNSIELAKVRAAYYEAKENVEFLAVAPEQLLRAALDCTDSVGVFVLYAVLEHLTPTERLEYLASMWSKLPEGGAIVVIDTPNRLTWEDKHTAYMDFFHMLPDEYVCDYAGRSPRPFFEKTMKGLDKASFRESRYRWGLGASFHEFELALREKLDEVLVADGLEQEMIDMFPVGEDEAALRQYFLRRGIPQPIGFSRAVLNLIVRKTTSASERQANAAYNARSRERERDRCFPSGGLLDRVRGVFNATPELERLQQDLMHCGKLAEERYAVIQQMDRMIRERNEEIERLNQRLRDLGGASRSSE
jgi:2-polyprenyl-3-methyl-5-hydroxy-6-metoxy-1,4-benzoquinol methylase